MIMKGGEMAFYSINNFIYDSETNNIRVQLTREVEAGYPFVSETGPAYEVLEAQIYLDGSTALVGKYYPESIDGTIEAHIEGRDLGQFPDVVPAIPLPE
jgi:hypothetical protein